MFEISLTDNFVLMNESVLCFIELKFRLSVLYIMISSNNTVP